MLDFKLCAKQTKILISVYILICKTKLNQFPQAAAKAKQGLIDKLAEDDPEDVWLALDGWSAVTTGYIGAELCT